MRREIFREYMRLTDSGAYGPYALQRAGALRLSKEEFAELLHDISKTGRMPIQDWSGHEFIDGLGLFEALHLVSSQKREALSEMEILECLMQVIADTNPLLQAGVQGQRQDLQ